MLEIIILGLMEKFQVCIYKCLSNSEVAAESSSNFVLASNNKTVKCDNASFGDTGD